MMKALLITSSVCAVSAFAPSSSLSLSSSTSSPSFGIVRSNGNNNACAGGDARACTSLKMNMFFAQEEEQKEDDNSADVVNVMADAQVVSAKAAAENARLDTMTEEEEIEALVQKELSKSKKISNLRNADGVDYAPWMGITADDEDKMRQLMKERTAARRKRQEQERDVSGNLFLDSQAQELSGTGLNAKCISGNVELEWATKSEANTKGFTVKRRAGKTNDYSVLASYKEWGPLASKGSEGGIYRYLDTNAEPGTWVYRISEEDESGNESDVCQCLVEVQTEDEQRNALIAGVGIVVLGVGVLAAGVLIDPMNGY